MHVKAVTISSTYFSAKFQMKSVAYKYFGYTWGIFIDLLQPFVEWLEGPPIGDIKYKNDSICSPRITLDDRREPTLARRVPANCQIIKSPIGIFNRSKYQMNNRFENKRRRTSFYVDAMSTAMLTLFSNLIIQFVELTRVAILSAFHREE